MSNWTHVNSVFRIDNIRPLIPDPNFTKLFGKVCTYKQLEKFEYELESCPENFLPFGSEGSCNMSIWVNPDVSNMASYTVSVFGDLRDHDGTGQIVDWFINVLHKLGNYPVRQAVITAENEWDNNILTAVLVDDKICVTTYNKDGTVIETNIKEV